MAFALSITTTHTKTLVSPSTGSEDKVYGEDYVAADSHTSALAVAEAISGGIPYFSSASAIGTSALLAANSLVIGGGAGAAPYTSAKLSEGAAAGEGLILSAGTAVTAVSPFTLSQTRNNNGVTHPGVVWTYTDTSVGGTAPLFTIKGGASGTTELFKIGKAGALSISNVFTFDTDGAIYGNAIFASNTRFQSGLRLDEQSAPTGTANAAKIFTQDNGAGKTQLMVIFGSGSAIQLAIEV